MQNLQKSNKCPLISVIPDPQSDSKSKSKSQRCDQRPDMLSTVLEILDWAQIFEATQTEPLLRRELVEQWWSTWSSGGVVVLGGGTRYLSVETSLFIHAKEQSPENRERQEWQKNCGD